jgi:hypothetical protein
MKATLSDYPKAATALLALTLAACASSVIQRADLSFEPPIPDPAFAEGEGPVVQIDEAHFNYHTADGRYAPFAKLLRRDGYVVRGLAEPATAESLARGDIYVIANAIAESDRRNWKLPTEPAFTKAEIEAIREWIDGGGSLFLIADHMPMPGAVEDLAAAFGVLFTNGFLYDSSGKSLLDFTREAGLADHPITRGRDESERIDSVRTFTGQAFRAEGEIEPLLTVPPGSRLRLPIEAWKFKPTTPSIPATGMFQGAVLRFGQGRVALFGEAAMFSAQEQIRKNGDRRVMGMNHPDAAQNPQFLLNVMHWLSGLIG